MLEMPSLTAIVVLQKILENSLNFSCAIFPASSRSTATEITSCPLRLHVIARERERNVFLSKFILRIKTS